MHGVNFEHLGHGKGFHLTDYPEADRVVAINGVLAQKLADYALHRNDLHNALQCLEEVAKEDLGHFTRSMLWRMAIINYSRCFKNNNARPNNLYINSFIHDPDGIWAHEYFITLRDKNIAHDDNSFTQCLPGAIINKPNAPHKIEKIITMSVTAESYDSGSIQNLRQLVSAAQAFITSEYDRLCSQITSELEARNHTDLAVMPLLQYNKPSPDIDVKVNRPRHG